MTLRDLEYVIALAEEGHFGRAAERCHVSQPTLSAQLAKLEDLLGVVLFERTRRRVAITPAGLEIVAACRRTLQEAEQVRAIAHAHRDPLAGPFHLGIIPTISLYLVPPLLRRLGAACPRLDLILVEDTTDRLLDALDRGDLDAAVIATQEPAPGREDNILYHEAFLAAVHARSDLAGGQGVTTAHLLESELLLLTDGHCLRDQALEVCGRQSETLGNVRATGLMTLVQLVAVGQGVTLVPALACPALAAGSPDVVFLPLADRPAARTVRLVSRRGFPRQAAIRAVIEAIGNGSENPDPDASERIHLAPPPDPC